MKIWIHDCAHVHEECSTRSPSDLNAPLPTRVIDVGNLENLHIWETCGQRGEYIALSYCWGEGKKLLNTTHRYEAFQTQLPIEEMPATFEEACEVAHKLGYQFLWIDALCMVQDDPADVQREMSKMGSIYQNATITIFAANGTDTDAGLWSCRDGHRLKPCDVVVTVNEREEPERKEFAVFYPQPLHSHPSENPLSKRGNVALDRNLAFLLTRKLRVGSTGADSKPEATHIHPQRGSMAM